MLAQFFQVVICDLSQPQIARFVFVAFKALLNMVRLLWFVFIVASTFQRTRPKNGSCTQETGVAPQRKPTAARGNRLKMGPRVGLVANPPFPPPPPPLSRAKTSLKRT